MGRRRALAALAGMATAGLVVAGWELSRPGPAGAGNLAAQRRASSAAPGTKLWSFKTNGTVYSVAVTGGVAYVGTVQRAVYALDALTGKLLWRHLMDGGQTYYLAPASGAVIAASGYNGVAPAGFNGGVYALDPGTGKLLWSALSTVPVGLVVDGDVAYAGTAIKSNTTGGVTALSTGTGELLWTFDFPTPADIAQGLVTANGVVYTTTSRGEIFALGASSGNLLWQRADPAITFRGAPEVADGVVYASSSYNKQDNSSPVMYAVDARTGHGLWQRPLGTALYSFPSVVADGLIFGCLIRELNSSRLGAGGLSALNAASGQQLWQVPVAGAVWTVRAGPGNVVYTGNSGGVFDAWQANTGNHLWSYRAAGILRSNIVVDDGIAYFGGTDRRVYAVAAH